MKFSLYNGLIVRIIKPQPHQTQGFDKDPFPVKCVLQAPGDGLVETYLDDKPEQHLAASVACTLALSVGLAGMKAAEMTQWCKANMIALRHIQVELFGTYKWMCGHSLYLGYSVCLCSMTSISQRSKNRVPRRRRP